MAGETTITTTSYNFDSPSQPLKNQYTLPSLIAVTSTDGKIYLSDGEAMRLLDANPAAPSATVTHLEPNGTSTENANGPKDVVLAEGAARTEQVRVTYEGALLQGREGTVSGLALESAVDLVGAGVQAGDRVVFGDHALCPDAEVAAVAPNRLDFVVIGADCQGAVTFTVRPAGEYVVAGSRSGYMGRARAQEAFSYSGAYYHRPDGYTPAAPAIAFVMGEGDPRRDAAYVLDIQSGITPSYIELPGLSFPGAVAWDGMTKRFYVAHLGGNAVVQIDPAAVEWGAALSESGFKIYR